MGKWDHKIIGLFIILSWLGMLAFLTYVIAPSPFSLAGGTMPTIVIISILVSYFGLEELKK